MNRHVGAIITLIPAIGTLVVFNRLDPFILGFPFVIFWSILWLFLTSLFLLIVFLVDPANKGEDEDR